ncbi:MAG: ParB/RepB/Spo0J family partition protein [Methylophilaceae bacterium]|jgi:ParB family chromosome partitioning protein|nr:ParB/RepB/Spo0J family partition protein [Methylophilaceae bacterium]MBL6726647.1 ParB/RepB/Spo0J family partition protein [Methylophilaceae bacterium]MBL6728084.1 ParB/RepB/Spo0J family partition protein [Methylophilaceae bacterium]MBL6790490.1 ParB/RepB/Spo0J family partition protein [Methylophilaceae bacterium]
MKTKGLGRGLDALLGNSEEINNADSNGLTYLKIDDLGRGKYQPRKSMDNEQLQELASSIEEQGIIQPILVRLVSKNNYEIIAGERRWQAAKIAGLKEVPVLIKEISDNDALALALIENIQRENLNVIEEAQGIKRLIEEFGMTHEGAATSLGKSRVAVTNLLRLLNLNERVQHALLAKKIDMGHARALVSLPASNQVMLCQKIIAENLSVRDIERIVSDSSQKTKKRTSSKSEDLRILENEISEKLGMKVSFHHNPKGNGFFKVTYTNIDEIQNFINKLR